MKPLLNLFRPGHVKLGATTFLYHPTIILLSLCRAMASPTWQVSSDVWVLAHTKLVSKNFAPPSDARAVESSQKLSEDWERRKPVMSQSCPWQRHLATEPRGQSALRNLEEDLKSKIIHPSTQPLVKQILNHLSSSAPEDIDIWYMSALRAAASSAHGAGTFLIGSCSNPLCPSREEGQTIPYEPHRLSFAIGGAAKRDKIISLLMKPGNLLACWPTSTYLYYFHWISIFLILSAFVILAIQRICVRFRMKGSEKKSAKCEEM